MTFFFHSLSLMKKKNLQSYNFFTDGKKNEVNTKHFFLPVLKPSTSERKLFRKSIPRKKRGLRIDHMKILRVSKVFPHSNLCQQLINYRRHKLRKHTVTQTQWGLNTLLRKRQTLLEEKVNLQHTGLVKTCNMLQTCKPKTQPLSQHRHRANSTNHLCRYRWKRQEVNSGVNN